MTTCTAKCRCIVPHALGRDSPVVDLLDMLELLLH